MKQPPVLLERILIALLPRRDRATVPGDFEEEFRSRGAGWRACAWYALGVATFVPYAIQRTSLTMLTAKTPLLVVCGFTSLCGLWLGSMSILLHHQHWVQNGLIAVLILVTSVSCIAALFNGRRMVKVIALLPTLPVAYVAAGAWYSTLHSRDVEGYVLLISLALFVQVGLAWTVLLLDIFRPRTS